MEEPRAGGQWPGHGPATGEASGREAPAVGAPGNNPPMSTGEAAAAEHAVPRDGEADTAVSAGGDSGGVTPGDPAGADVPEEAGVARPLGVTVSDTGHPAVDTALRRLADVDHLPVSEHLTVYEDVHRELRDTLGALDQRPAAPSPAPHDTGS